MANERKSDLVTIAEYVRLPGEAIMTVGKMVLEAYPNKDERAKVAQQVREINPSTEE